MDTVRAKLAELHAQENEVELRERKAKRLAAQGFAKSAANIFAECAHKRAKIEQERAAL